MSKDNKKGDENNTLEKIVFITATLNLINALIEIIKALK